MQTCFSCWLWTFSCGFWSGDPVVSEETWINPTRAAFFYFFEIQGRRTRGGWGGSGRPTFSAFFFLFFFIFFFRFSQAKKKNKNWRDDTLIAQRMSLNKGSMIAFIAIVLCRSAAAMPWLTVRAPTFRSKLNSRYTHECRDMYRCTAAIKARKRSWNRLIVHRISAQRTKLKVSK